MILYDHRNRILDIYVYISIDIIGNNSMIVRPILNSKIKHPRKHQLDSPVQSYNDTLI
jgi:hypothetical protein